MASEISSFHRVQPWVTTLARAGLAVVLGWAAIAKMGDPAAAARAVRAYRILPESLVHTVGYGLPFLEIALALLLLVGLGTRLSGAVSAVLFVVFIAGIASVWARGISIDCGCFGGGGAVASGDTHYLREILRDVGLLALASWVAVLPSSRLALDGLIAGGEETEGEETDGGEDGGVGPDASEGARPGMATEMRGTR